MRQICWLVGVATLLVVVVGSGVAVADGNVPDVPLRGPISFEAFDLDGSGAISPEEFDQTHIRRDEAREQAGLPSTRRRHAFGDVDADGNGQITSGELRAVHGAGREGRGQGPGRGAGRGMGSGHGPSSFADFDLDGDGAVSEQEFIDARTQRIGERVREGRMMRGLITAPSFAERDTDGDGSLTPEEFAAGIQTHQERMKGEAPDGVDP